MIKNYNTINRDLTLTHALEYLSKAENKCLIVLDGKKSVIGTLTDGDIRRSLIKSKDLNKKVGSICNKKFLYFNNDVSKTKIYETFLKNKRLFNRRAVLGCNFPQSAWTKAPPHFVVRKRFGIRLSTERFS